MATIAQARAALAARGFELDESVSNWTRDGGGSATIDAAGRFTIDGECRGQFVFDYTATRAEFWQMVIDEAAGLPEPTPCPEPAGTCPFHDDGGDE